MNNVHTNVVNVTCIVNKIAIKKKVDNGHHFETRAFFLEMQ